MLVGIMYVTKGAIPVFPSKAEFLRRVADFCYVVSGYLTILVIAISFAL